MSLADRLEFSTPADRALNYCLWEYDRPTPPEDKFRSINLLYQSFGLATIDQRAYSMLDAIRDCIGSWRTVFGIKYVDRRLAWEFYFYDYRRRLREVSISRVLAAIRPYISCRIAPNEALPYFMFSLDLNEDLVAGRHDMDLIHVYVGNPGSTVSSGIAYALRRESTTLENFYFFFDAATQLPEAAKKIGSSAVFDETRVPVEEVLVPELRRCKTICVANKQSHDCVYFSGIDVDQLILFLARLEYPPETVAFVRDNRSNFDHLLFDAGFDYRLEKGALRVLKSGYYGVF